MVHSNLKANWVISLYSTISIPGSHFLLLDGGHGPCVGCVGATHEVLTVGTEILLHKWQHNLHTTMSLKANTTNVSNKKATIDYQTINIMQTYRFLNKKRYIVEVFLLFFPLYFNSSTYFLPRNSVITWWKFLAGNQVIFFYMEVKRQQTFPKNLTSSEAEVKLPLRLYLVLGRVWVILMAALSKYSSSFSSRL